MQRLGLLIIAGMLAVASAQAQLRNGLVCYWPLDGIESDHTPDLVSKNHLYLYHVGDSNVVAGKYGNAFSFNGASQFLALNYAKNPKLPIVREQNYTISFWIKAPLQRKNATIFAEGYTQSDNPSFRIGAHRTTDGQGLGVFLRSKDMVQLDNVLAEMPIFDNTWHHLAWVDRNGQGQLYIDGRLDVASFIYQRREVQLNNLSIGALFRSKPAAFFKGVVDDVALWQRALTREEIAQVANGELSLLFKRKPRT